MFLWLDVMSVFERKAVVVAWVFEWLILTRNVLSSHCQLGQLALNLFPPGNADQVILSRVWRLPAAYVGGLHSLSCFFRRLRR